MLICYVTLWPWPLTRWPWTFVHHRCHPSLYEIWAKSNNPRWIIDDLAKSLKGCGLPNSTPQRKMDKTEPNLGRTEFRHRCTKQDTLVPICCFVSKWGWLKNEWCRRSRSMVYTASGKLWDQNVFCNISYKTRSFRWYTVSWLKLRQNHVNNFHFTWITSLHYFVKLKKLISRVLSLSYHRKILIPPHLWLRIHQI